MTDVFHAPPGVGQRSLSEPVLTSVEEEWVADDGSHGTAAVAPQPTWPNAGTWLQEPISRFVSERPLRAALLALGVGALAAALLGRNGGRRPRKE
jgi:hypothetical protein